MFEPGTSRGTENWKRCSTYKKKKYLSYYYEILKIVYYYLNTFLNQWFVLIAVFYFTKKN